MACQPPLAPSYKYSKRANLMINLLDSYLSDVECVTDPPAVRTRDFVHITSLPQYRLEDMNNRVTSITVDRQLHVL